MLYIHGDFCILFIKNKTSEYNYRKSVDSIYKVCYYKNVSIGKIKSNVKKGGNITIFKKATKSICAIISSVMIINCVNVAGTAEPAKDNREIYNDLIQQLTNCNSQCLLLDNQYSQNMISETEYNSEKQSIYEEIDEIKSALSDIGADNADEDADKMADILASDGKNGVSGLTRTAVYSVPAYFKSILNSLSGVYDVYGRQNTYKYQGNTYDIYDITIVYSAQKNKNNTNNIRLAVNKVETFSEAFSANSEQARAWVNQILHIYEGKVASWALEKIPGVKFMPYELLFPENRPAPNTISSDGDSLVVTLATNTTMTYTFVSESGKNTWTHCLTDNMVAYAVSFTSVLHYGGSVNNKVYSAQTQLLYGKNFTTRAPSAAHVFSQMKQNKVNGIVNGCVKSVAVKGTAGGSVTIIPAHPDYLQGMLA